MAARAVALGIGLALAVAACTGPTGSPGDGGVSGELPGPTLDQAPSPRPRPSLPGSVPMVTADQACVPADEIHFDLFFAGATEPLSTIDPRTVERLRDAIPPLHYPAYETAPQATWLAAGDAILGYADGDEAYAYPIRIMNFHEIVNEEVNGRPVLISYCPLCASGIAYDRRLDGEALTFGNTSALYESDLVMYDYQTGSYWQQVLGEGIVGPMCGRRLELLPLLTTTWAQWRALHPDTLVLSRATGYPRDYDRDPFVGYAERLDQGRFPFPVGESAHDDRLPAGDMVLAIRLSGAAYAWSLTRLGDGVANEAIGDTPVVVFSQTDVTDGVAVSSGAAFGGVLDGRQLTFEWSDGGFFDRETGSRWTLDGAAVDGPLAGSRLTPIPARTTFWFAIVATTPDIEVRHP